MNMNLWTKLFLTAILGLGVALYGCPPTTPADDDDDNDDAGDDDGGDDDMGDDDAGDDDGGDDDTHPASMTGYAQTTEPNGYLHEQSLAGVQSSSPCSGCEYTFDITYSTTNSAGTCVICWDFPDGVYTLGYDADYQGAYELILYNGSFWYVAYAGYGGHNIAFFYQTKDKSITQYGYWDW